MVRLVYCLVVFEYGCRRKPDSEEARKRVILHQRLYTVSTGMFVQGGIGDVSEPIPKKLFTATTRMIPQKRVSG